MPQYSTYLAPEDVRDVIAFGGESVRQFLAFVLNPREDSQFARLPGWQDHLSHFQERFQAAAEEFLKTPHDFATERLCEKGSDYQEAIHHFVRIEVRDTTPEGQVSQVVVKGVAGEFRKILIDAFCARSGFEDRNLVVKSSGSTSIEFNAKNVNKSLPLKYLKYNLDYLLEFMNYQPGAFIDARQTATVIAADGDGTTYPMPKTGQAPGIAASAAFDELQDYLYAGGVYVMISGNDLKRTIDRLSDLPEDLLLRVVVAASGGANLAVFREGKTFELVGDYLLNAQKLCQLDEPESLDAVYLGDDGKAHGNDFSAFAEIGFEKSVFVGEKALLDPELAQVICLEGFDDGVRRFLKGVNAFVQANPTQYVFEPFQLKKICQEALL